MKSLHRPVLTSVLFGLICGASFIPLDLVSDNTFFRSKAVSLSLWLFTAGYAVLLCRWSGQKWISVSYPVLFLFLTVFLVQSLGAFFVLALAATSWVRSGLCFQERRGLRLVVELLLCAAGGGLVAVFTPGSALAWAQGIWLFFLLQALYFAIFDDTAPSLNRINTQTADPFERASRQAEDILSTPRQA